MTYKCSKLVYVKVFLHHAKIDLTFHKDIILFGFFLTHFSGTAIDNAQFLTTETENVVYEHKTGPN